MRPLTVALLIWLAASPAWGDTITRVIDGDTFDIAVNGTVMRVRLADVDTPEIKGKCLYEQTLAVRAKGFVQTLPREVEIEIVGVGYYGRTLARITVLGRDLGTMLVEAGLAKPYRGRRESWCK